MGGWGHDESCLLEPSRRRVVSVLESQNVTWCLLTLVGTTLFHLCTVWCIQGGYGRLVEGPPPPQGGEQSPALSFGSSERWKGLMGGRPT